MSRRWFLPALWIVLAALLAAGGQQAVRRGIAAAALPTGSAEWIWEADRHRQTVPWALWAVRDFEISERPETAHVLILADESHVLYLNGRRIGSNVYRKGMDLDRYPVAPWLRPGANRLAVELRSTRGAGGLLLALVDDTGGEPLVVTDRRWSIFTRDHPGILAGWLPVSEGEPVFSWGRPPIGRWGTPRRWTERPAFPQTAGEPWELRPMPPVRVAEGSAVLEALRSGDETSWRSLSWRPVGPGSVNRPPDGSGLGAAVIFDWGREVTGYLTLDRSRGGARASGLLLTGRELAELTLERAENPVVTVTDASLWRDELPRRFRYAVALGADWVAGAWVDPLVDPVTVSALERLPAPPLPSPGVFGVAPPWLETPVEHEVRRKLQSFARGARREDP